MNGTETIADRARPLPWLQGALLFTGYVIVYIALDWVSLVDPVGVFAITPWNPPPGLSIALLLRYGLRYWPWLFVAEFLSNRVVGGAPASIAINAAASLLLAASYTGVVALLVGPLRFRADFRRLRDAVVFTVTLAIATGVISVAFVALSAESGLVPSNEFVPSVVQFWIGDLIGILVTTPALLVLARPGILATLKPSRETLAQALSIAIALWVIFGWGIGHQLKLFFILFLPLIWIATRRGLEGTMIAIVAIQVALIVAVEVAGRKDGTILEFQFLMLALAVTGLLLSVAVSERTAIERALHDKQAELERSLRLASASELASALAHELNQPLSAISAYIRACQLMRDQGASRDEVMAQTMDKIVAEVNRAGTVVRRLREFFRTGAAQVERVAVSTLIDNALVTTRERALRHGVTVIGQAAGVPDVAADRVQVGSVLHNLINNAIDALKDSAQPARTVRIACALDEGGLVRLTVQDNGPGVNADMTATLFLPFATSKPDGTGLGLAISRSIVEAHGGRLWYEPSGDGSIFAFTLPVASGHSRGVH
ncbi:MAG TPA: MASE1 domain-containing protein [Casimicrobiaceae bacterium]|nr:MASE1 domain-containing protein [Casimicrobiaceae bacterium]